MRFSVIQRAPDEHTKFTSASYAGAVGRSLNVHTPRGSMPGTLVSAEVQEDGGSVELTFDVPGLDIGLSAGGRDG